jgi:alkylation response protein AidB-like acyl-CoA dehydrogenase
MLIEQLSYADGSVGWCTVVANVSASLLAGIDKECAQAIAAEPHRLCIAGGFPPRGRAERDGDTYRLTGRWSFASGCRSATWFIGGMVAGGAPLVAFFPAEQARIVRNWDALGLRATGSHDVVVENLDIPVGRTTPLVGGPRWSSDPIAAIPFFSLSPLLGAVPLGIARRALAELAALAATKTRLGSQEPLLNESVFQDKYAAVAARLNAAATYLYDQAAQVWAAAIDSGTVSPEIQATAGLATSEVADAALAAVQFAHLAAGTSALAARSVLSRCLTDVITLARHPAFAPLGREAAGKVLLSA